MNALMTQTEMLYCPKCKREYEDGKQRFCNNDGDRLLPAPAGGAKKRNQEKGVFTSLLGRTQPRFERDEKLAPKPRASSQRSSAPSFEPSARKVFKTESLLTPKPHPRIKKPVLSEPPKLESKIKPAEKKTAEKPVPPAPKSKPKIPFASQAEQPAKEEYKPIARLINPTEIESGTAPIGNRELNPKGRGALTRSNPDALVGQVVKGRYIVKEGLSADSTSIAYVAEDNILKGQNVIVRVLMQTEPDRGFEEKIFAEERISLSHVNHPNVAKVIDSGELPEGKPFIVTAESRATSVESLASAGGALNPQRVGRIIKQASYALGEVHQAGVLHRNLLPEHLLLTVSDAGVEQVKVTDFCVSDGTVTDSNFRYKAPEQIGGQLPTFASDSYSLAVIAFKLLTGRYPFNGENARELLASQKAGLIAKPSEFNPNILSETDEIISRALSFDPSQRYSKAREFGELLFDSLADTKFDEEPLRDAIPAASPDGSSAGLRQAEPETTDNPDMISISSHQDYVDEDSESEHLALNTAETEAAEIEDTEFDAEKAKHNESLWKNRSPEPVLERGLIWAIVPAVGFLCLILFVFAAWRYFLSHESEVIKEPPPMASAVDKTKGVDSNRLAEKAAASDIETPPPTRQITAPANTIYFENSKLDLTGDLLKQFRGFSLYYPQNWKRKYVDKRQNKVDDKFIDIAISDGKGIPIEQFMISPYESNGTFKSDTEIFAKLVEKSNKDSSESLRPASYEVISQGATTIQDGRWKAYQVNFESKGKLPDGTPLTLWGRRLWIPIQRPGAKAGFIVTMLATSLSKEVKSADDVGKLGDIAQILETFEPVQEF